MIQGRSHLKRQNLILNLFLNIPNTQVSLSVSLSLSCVCVCVCVSRFRPAKTSLDRSKRAQLTSVGLQSLAGHCLANKVILQKAGGLLRNLHWWQRTFLPGVDNLTDGVGVFGERKGAELKHYYLSIYTEKFFVFCKIVAQIAKLHF